MVIMLFFVFVVNGMFLGVGGSMGLSFGFYGLWLLYNIKWNGKVSGFFDFIVVCVGVFWCYNLIEKWVEFYYLDIWIFCIYVFDDVNMVDFIVCFGMMMVVGISGDGFGFIGQNGSFGISGDFGSKQIISFELKILIFSDIENSINLMLMLSMGCMLLLCVMGILIVID